VQVNNTKLLYEISELKDNHYLDQGIEPNQIIMSQCYYDKLLKEFREFTNREIPSTPQQYVFGMHIIIGGDETPKIHKVSNSY